MSKSIDDALRILQLERALAKVKRENADLKLRVKTLEREGGSKQVSEGVVEIPANMLTRLIRLAHPDRHGNSAEANEVTRLLIELRSGSRE